MTPDKIYIYRSEKMVGFTWNSKESKEFGNIEYIRKDALLEWANAKLERLWELVPDYDKVENETATPMEMRYLGQYMQMESVIDKLNSM